MLLMFRLPTIFLLCVACQVSLAGGSVDIAEIEISGITFSDLSTRVKDVFGEPIESGPKCNDCIDIMDSWYVYDGLKIKFLVDEVFDFEVTSKEHRLPSGLGVGSSAEEIADVFGEPVTWVSGDTTIHTYAVTGKNGQRTAIKLDFLIRENTVVGFETNHRWSDAPES